MNEQNKKSKNIFEKIKEKFVLVSKGEANFNSMLYFWGVAPGVIITIFFQRKIMLMNIKYIQAFFYFIILLYFLWHFFVVRKTLKVQPQYKVIKLKKKELYEGKTKEEIEKIKKEKRNDKMKKLLLLKGWNTTPSYIIVQCFDVYLFLTQLQGLYNIFFINR